MLAALMMLAWLGGPAPAPEAAATPGPEAPATVPLAEALVIRAGATCIERDRLVAQVRSWIELERVDARLVVEVVGDPHEARKLAFSLRLGDDVIAVRRFDPAPARCSDLHSVVGLAIALAIDATLLENLTPPPREVPVDAPEPEPEPEPPPVTPVPTERPKPQPAPQVPPRPWALWAELTGVFTMGAPPGVGGGARFGLYGRYRELLDLGVGVIASSSGGERVGDGSALLSAAAGRFDLCVGPRLGRIRLRGCTGVLAGAALAAGQGFETDTTTRVPWVAIPVGARFEARLAERFAFLFGVEGQGNVVRPGFEAVNLAGQRSSRNFARFSGALELGLAILLW